MKYILAHFPIVLLTVFVALLGALNYDSGTLLTGGDNLHPEFNFALNIKRSLFATWQEYQGVGLLGGMGHASDLLRQLFLLPFSLFLPMEFLRYFWAYLTLLIGALGAFYLIRTLLTHVHLFEKREERPYEAHATQPLLSRVSHALISLDTVALTGSLFYLLNLATVQAYYTPFEVFMAHFAALPWLLLTTYLYSKNPSRKHLLWLLATLLLSTPQGYVPTLFVVAVLAMTVVAVFSRPLTASVLWLKQTALRLFKLYTLVVVINAFWLLPFTYFTLTSAEVNVNAKINQMATEMIFQQNKEVGSITDVMLLKGFWLNNVEPNLDGVSTYMLLPWREHLSQPFILGIGYLFFAEIVFGLFTALRKKSLMLIGFAVLFALTFTMLTTATPPFSWINSSLREYVPLFNQVFRFPFTKFSLLAGLTYAVFFAVGIQSLVQYTSRLPWSRLILTPVMVGSLMVFSLPLFQGHMFYERETIALPQEYKDTFAFFAEQDPQSRIANFPQHTYWGWNFYDWGYSGSGFLWYGIEQPILDRAFDVWNPYSENYYFELSQAVYAQDREAFDNVLQKYDVTWLLVDKNIVYPTSPQSLFIEELEEMISNIPSISPLKDFGNVEIYSVAQTEPLNSFVSVGKNLPTVNSYTWNNNDTVFTDIGTYISTDIETPDYWYPFRSLFSQKTEEQQEFTLTEQDTSLVLTTTLPQSQRDRTIQIPQTADTEQVIPVTITTQEATAGAILITALVKSPELWVDDHKLTGDEAEIDLFTLPATTTFPLTLNINGVVNIKITAETQEITTSLLSLTQENTLTLTTNDLETVSSLTITPQTLTSLPTLASREVVIPKNRTSQQLRVVLPKVTDNYANFTPSLATQPSVSNCDYFRQGEYSVESIKNDTTYFLELWANNATACISYYAPTLSHKYAYALFLKHKNTAGRDLHFWILNEDQGYAPLDTYVLSDTEEKTTSFVLPPQEQFGTAYSLHFDSISIGNTLAHNSISHISMHPLPYTSLTMMRLKAAGVPEEPQQTFSTPKTVTHPNESLYVVSGLQLTNSHTLILSQSYDEGWNAYAVENDTFLAKTLPFLTGTKLEEHVKVNNWSNGWLLDPSLITQQSSIVIVYLPQYLQYLGFILPLVILPFFLLKKNLFHLKKNA